MEVRRLNTLRALAALIVVVSHFSNATESWGGVLGHGAGQLGVMLFFMLSGFLMTFLYWGKKPTLHNLLSYVVSRVSRVVPLYLIVVLISFTTQYMYNIRDVYSLIQHLLFIRGIDVLWTIPPEMQFYLLFGIAWLISNYKPMIVPLLIIVGFIVSFYASKTIGEGIFVFPIVIAIPYFLLGCLLGGFYKHINHLLKYQSNWYLLAIAFLPLLYPRILNILFGFTYNQWIDIGAFLIVGMVFFCVVFLVPNQNIFLENKIGDFLGKISYSFYLLHMVVISLLVNTKLAGFGLFSLSLLIITTSFIAWVSFRFVEMPLKKLIRKTSKI